MKTLMQLLTTKRPSGFEETYQLAEDLFKPLGGSTDKHHNWWIQVGANPTVSFTAHYDTMHKKLGKNKLVISDNIIDVAIDPKTKRGDVLGADDASGIWLMLEMIEAGREGLYLFFADEEIGRVGSESFDKELLKNIDVCISFDRMNYGDIITHQSWERCASVEATDWFCDGLNNSGQGLEYSACDEGSYTDSYTFRRLIPECFNVSVGYFDQHTYKESQDLDHLRRLRTALLTMDFKEMPVKRDPKKTEVFQYDSWNCLDAGDSVEELTELCREQPEIVAAFLAEQKATVDEIWEVCNLPEGFEEEWFG